MPRQTSGFTRMDFLLWLVIAILAVAYIFPLLWEPGLVPPGYKPSQFSKQKHHR